MSIKLGINEHSLTALTQLMIALEKIQGKQPDKAKISFADLKRSYQMQAGALVMTLIRKQLGPDGENLGVDYSWLHPPKPVEPAKKPTPQILKKPPQPITESDSDDNWKDDGENDPKQLDDSD